MSRWTIVLSAILAITACSADHVTQSTSLSPSPDEFTGVWRSITPSLEFIRLTVNSKSSQHGVFAGRLAYSGVAWDGEGSIDGDSLVMSLSVPGVSGPGTQLVLRRGGEDTLRASHSTPGAGALDLTLIREH